MKPIVFAVAVLLVFTSAVMAAPSINEAAQATQVATPSADSASANVRLINASQNSPAVDIYINNSAVGTNLKYGAATDFMPISAGAYAVDVRPAGGASSTKPIYTINFVFGGGTSINLVAVGPFGSTGTKGYKIAEFMTRRSPTQGKARVEFFQTVPSAPTVDVVEDTEPVLTEIKFAKQPESLLNVDPGKYNLSIVPTGKTSPALLSLTGTTLSADTIYSVIIMSDTTSAALKPMTLTTTPLSNSEATMAATASQ